MLRILGVLLLSAQLATAAAPEARHLEVRRSRLFPNLAFAQPPVGARRWREPLPETRLRQLKESVSCPQLGKDDLSREPMRESEDCLYLNVWAPLTGTGHPVLFLIHGGGLTAGSGLRKFYDGSIFAREGVVFVSFNYRLAELGFGPRKNGNASLGLLDQAAALRWVEENIAGFGGDPRRIFLMGHSKGAEAALALLESGLAGTSVRGAVALSGARHFAEKFTAPPFAPGEEGWDTARLRKAAEGKIYFPELPVLPAGREGRVPLLASSLYDERMGLNQAASYCETGASLRPLPAWLDPYFFVWHPGTYQHGAELRSLFRQDTFGRRLRELLVQFVKTGRVPAASDIFPAEPFRRNAHVSHVFSELTLPGEFAEAPCPGPGLRGSEVNEFYRGLEAVARQAAGWPEPRSWEPLTPPPELKEDRP